jgi:DNA polymerase III gamma/tau subunit
MKYSGSFPCNISTVIDQVDALSLLDQTISYAEGKVTANDVTAVVGKTSIEFVGKVIQSIAPF